MVEIQIGRVAVRLALSVIGGSRVQRIRLQHTGCGGHYVRVSTVVPIMVSAVMAVVVM